MRIESRNFGQMHVGLFFILLSIFHASIGEILQTTKLEQKACARARTPPTHENERHDGEKNDANKQKRYVATTRRSCGEIFVAANALIAERQLGWTRGETLEFAVVARHAADCALEALRLRWTVATEGGRVRVFFFVCAHE